jgi:hypothetical protein
MKRWFLLTSLGVFLTLLTSVESLTELSFTTASGKGAVARQERAPDPVRVSLAPFWGDVQARINDMTSRRPGGYPRIDPDGRLSFPEPVIESARHFGAAIAAVVKKHAEANFPEYDAWDTEGYVYLNGAKALLRVVVGKDGASRENAKDAKGAVDGVSIGGLSKTVPAPS